MRNVDLWRPSKVTYSSDLDAWVPNPSVVAPMSRFMVGLAVARYREYIEKYASGSLLDCGCGSVPYYGMYKDQVADVTCVDWPSSRHDTQFADELADINHGLPFPDESFDTIILSDVLEHIYEPKRLMAEVSRTLRLDGVVLCFVPFMYWIHEDPHDYYRYTEHALRDLCERNALGVLEIGVYGGGPDVVVDVAGKVVAGNKVLEQMVTFVSGLTVGSGPYRRLRARTMNQIPLGYMMAAQKRAGTARGRS